jgi:type IV pilus assembly protein PilM
MGLAIFRATMLRKPTSMLPAVNKNKKRNQILAIDLGSRATKAVLLERRQESFTMSRFSITDAPTYEKGMPQGLLTEHLRSVVESMSPKTRQVTIAVGSDDSILRSTDMPLLPLGDMRQMLKFNSKNYLQQDFRDYVFDCYIVPPQQNAQPEAGKPANKYKVWVGGAKREWLTSMETAVKGAGLTPDQVTLTVLGPINALELAEPEIFAKEVVALVDLGFRTTTISILNSGDLCLNRTVEIGGDKLTAGLSEAMGISYAEAEGIKIGMPKEVESHLQPLISPLGRELRASIDFFEHQREKTVSQVLVSGGAARSEFILEMLRAELGVPCRSWQPTAAVHLSLSPQQMTEVEQVSGQLAVAIGAATTAF